MVAAMVFSITWLVANYKLKRRHMEHQYRYKNDVMQQLGLLITDDERVITKEGDVISTRDNLIAMEKKDNNKFQILPPPQ
jgi:lipopolysaccharide export LptBFGC system permease protein LptF